MAERRMLWKSISRSRKVNLGLKTLEAKILFTWSIPYADRDGFLEGDSLALKTDVVPLVKEITYENIDIFVEEIARAGLWEIYEVGDNRYIRIIQHLERQILHPHEGKSKISPKIKGLKPMSFTCNDNV